MNTYTCELLIDEFNSQVFQQKMGNIILTISKNQNLDAEEAILRILEKAENMGFKHLTCKIPTSDTRTVNMLEKYGFYLVDTALTFAFFLNKSKLPQMKYKCTLDDCKEEDIPVLKKIARESYQIDRFHSDETLANEFCDEYYEKWVENSYRGFADKTLVAYYDGVPVGFETGKRRRGTPYYDLVLAAVDKDARGLGVYTSMIHSMTQHVINLAEQDDSLKAVLLETQVDNIPVLKAWISLGYTADSSLYVMHKHI